jgi:hypothetical protein
MILFPTRKQWNEWSLPSKLGALSAWLAFIGAFLSIALYIYSAVSELINSHLTNFRGSQVVLYLKDTPMRCEWNLVRVSDSQDILVRETEACPDVISWSPDKSVILYGLGGNLYWSLWKKGASPQLLKEIPYKESSDGTPPDLFFDQTSNRPRVSFMVEPLIESETADRRIYFALGKRFDVILKNCELGEIDYQEPMGYRRAPIPMGESLVRVPDCPQEYFHSQFGGVSAEEMPSSKLVKLPGHGVLHIAVVMEWAKSGDWIIVDAAPTKSEATGTPYFDVVDEARRGLLGSISTIELTSTCGEVKCIAAFDPKVWWKKAIWEELKARYADHKVMRLGGGFGVIQKEGVNVFYFPIIKGSLYHAYTPINYASVDNKSLVELPYHRDVDWIGFPGQIDTSAYGDYFMVSEESSGLNAEVFRYSDAKMIAEFREGRSYLLPMDISDRFFEE